jgi:HEAT repeat protein
MMKTEQDSQAREVMMIALTCCGDKSHEAEMIEIVQRDGNPTIRSFAIEALGNNGCHAAVPALLKQLEDPYEVSAGCLRTHGEETEFPVRDYSARALRRLGVKVDYVEGGEYKVDDASVEQALTIQDAEQEPSEVLAEAAGP